MPNIIDLNNFAEGAVSERLNQELQKVLENIADPNTDPTKARKVTLTITLKADDKRDLAMASVVAKSSIVPAKSIDAKIIMDLDNGGKITGAELKSGIKGQTYVTDEGEIADDKGEIINFKQKKSN
ncbi:replication terminator protein [Lederbergia lenta]|uniref:replication terminator protein n=1 Tax=Lederbergia lenta TaxID=1467 RepID=UPI00203FD615|nr:replication terminator protein [Lederbergia lenta]MCM3111651.1 replication terminator protein [Lederbergia lenta]